MVYSPPAVVQAREMVPWYPTAHVMGWALPTVQVVGLVPTALAGSAALGAVSHLRWQLLSDPNAYPVVHDAQISLALVVQAVPVAAVPLAHVHVLASQTVAVVMVPWLESPDALCLPVAHAVQTPAVVT